MSFKNVFGSKKWLATSLCLCLIFIFNIRFLLFYIDLFYVHLVMLWKSVFGSKK